jgi:hypothetical protein
MDHLTAPGVQKIRCPARLPTQGLTELSQQLGWAVVSSGGLLRKGHFPSSPRSLEEVNSLVCRMEGHSLPTTTGGRSL